MTAAVRPPVQEYRGRRASSGVDDFARASARLCRAERLVSAQVRCRRRSPLSRSWPKAGWSCRLRATSRGSRTSSTKWAPCSSRTRCRAASGAAARVRHRAPGRGAGRHLHGKGHRQRLAARSLHLALRGEVRGKGLMVGVELVEDRTSKKPASAAAGSVRQYCLDHGVLIGVGGNFASALRV